MTFYILEIQGSKKEKKNSRASKIHIFKRQENIEINKNTRKSFCKALHSHRGLIIKCFKQYLKPLCEGFNNSFCKKVCMQRSHDLNTFLFDLPCSVFQNSSCVVVFTINIITN
jgi:hypothetical protein